MTTNVDRERPVSRMRARVHIATMRGSTRGEARSRPHASSLMAVVPRSATAGADTGSLVRAPQIAGDLNAGEALDIAAPCRIASDGMVYLSDGTADDAVAKFDGLTPRAVAADQPVSLYGSGARFWYETGLTPGARFSAAGKPGRHDTAPTTGRLAPIAAAINTTDIRVLHTHA